MQANLPENFTKTQAATIELVTAAGHAVLNSAGEFAPVAVEAARGALNEAATFVTTLQTAKTPQDVANVYANYAEAIRESATAFVRSAYDVAMDTQAKLQRLVDSHVATVQEGAHQAFDQVAGNVPGGATAFVDAFKQFAAAGNSSYQEMTKTLRTVSEAAVAKSVAANSEAPAARKTKASA